MKSYRFFETDRLLTFKYSSDKFYTFLLVLIQNKDFIDILLPFLIIINHIFMKNYLNFETEIKEIENELDKLKDPFNSEGLSQVNTDKILILEKDLDKKLKKIYSNLNPWQTTLVARHEDRPKAKFFLENIFEDFIQLSGDRFYGEDKSLISGFARFEGKSVLILGQEKGEDLDTRIERNFGMMRPEGYRKNVRLMKLAEKFNIPVISFIDTPGAYPGVGAEERGQAEAIAKSIECSLSLGVPTISILSLIHI